MISKTDFAEEQTLKQVQGDSKIRQRFFFIREKNRVAINAYF